MLKDLEARPNLWPGGLIDRFLALP